VNIFLQFFFAVDHRSNTPAVLYDTGTGSLPNGSLEIAPPLFDKPFMFHYRCLLPFPGAVVAAAVCVGRLSADRMPNETERYRTEPDNIRPCSVSRKPYNVGSERIPWTL
jgi:hypothetical protein